MLKDNPYPLLFARFVFWQLTMLMAFSVFGQDPYFFNYDTKDGLPSSEVYSVEVDSNGLLWFATDRGFCSYNGYEFKTYTTEDGLANNTILKIWKDRKGNFWLPGLDGSLTIFDHKKFYPYKWNDRLKKIQKGEWVEGVVWDNNDKPYFWFTSSRKYKFSFNKENRLLELYNFSTLSDIYHPTSTDSITFIDLDNYFFPNDTSSGFRMLKHKQDYFYTNISNKKAFISTDKISKFSTLDSTYSEYKLKGITSFYVDNHGDLWLCTNYGLFSFENSNLNNPPNQYFQGIAVSDIFNDSEDNYWITTLENGVLFVPSFNFKTILQPKGQLNTEKIVTINGLEENLIVSNSFGKIMRVSKNLEVHDLYSFQNVQQISFSYKFKNKTYIGSLIVNEQNGKINLTKCLNDEPGWKINELQNGQYFSLRFRGFSVYEKNVKFPIKLKKGKVQSGGEVYSSADIFDEIIIAFAEHKNKIWLGTLRGLYSISDYQFNAVEDESKNNPLLNGRINDIKADAFDNLWLATIGEGVLYKTKDTIFQFSAKDGFLSNLINRIFVENDSTIWIATDKGLNKLTYNYNEKKVVIKGLEKYTTIDGLQSNYINDITKWQENIWLATNKGINFFSPESIRNKLPPPKILLEEITVNDSVFHIRDNLDLTFNQNDLFFKFNGISYRKSRDRPFYRYRLKSENGDLTWYYTNNRDVRFNDLQPGDYIFEVAAQNKLGQWSTNPVLCHFTIRPHFTQTLWFRLVIGVMVISIIIALIINRNQRIKYKEEQKRKLQEAELKTKDAELQALRNQMNPHFVFNALNSIQNFVFKNDAKKANYYLARFSKLMRDGLQFARLKYISLDEEIIFLNTYLELEKMRFPDKFKYVVVVDEFIPTNRYFIPPLLFQPILENAVKHAFKNIDYEGLLEIKFEEKIPGELLKITIKDNGEGINLDSVNKFAITENKSLGLEIISNQIALLNSEGKDTKASFKIFNRSKLDPQLKGTQAEFLLSIKFSEND